MSVLNEEGQTQIVCNDCGAESHTVDKDDFSQLVSELKADGWRIAKPEGRWVHECKDCVSHNSALAQAQRKFGLR